MANSMLQALAVNQGQRTEKAEIYQVLPTQELVHVADMALVLILALRRLTPPHNFPQGFFCPSPFYMTLVAAGALLLALCCAVYGDASVRAVNCVLILCASALAFFSLSGVSGPENIAKLAMDSVDLSSVASRMREAMAINTGRVTKSFTTQISGNLVNHQETDNAVHLSDDDILRLTKAIDNAVRKGLSETVVKIDSKPAGKILTPVINEELGKINGRKT